jgi:two-component system response regulator AtoC
MSQSRNTTEGLEAFIGASPCVREIKSVISQIADSDLTVLVTGETGTGKDVVTRAIHHLSHRKERPFISINCAAIPENLLEAELFGYERGAYTGAHNLKPGRFEFANRGTLFLDEIIEMPPSLQAKLLRVIETKRLMRLGGTKEIPIDVRIIAATNRDLKIALKERKLREDLFYRLSEVSIHIPPLRERKEDIPLLVRYFLDRYSRKFTIKAEIPSEETLTLLTGLEWNGNVREIENFVKRFVMLNDKRYVIRGLIDASSDSGLQRRITPGSNLLPPSDEQCPSLRRIRKDASDKAERDAIIVALEKTRWNRSKAAKLLKVSYRNFLYRMRECGIRTPRTS